MAGLNAALPDPWPVRRAGRVGGAVEPPGSKSISNRALNLALVGQRPLTIENLLEADDIAAFLDVLRRMSWRVERGAGAEVRVEPPRGGPPDSPARLDCRSSGTLLRFLVASCAVTPGEWVVDGSPRLRERPIGPLLGALRGLGASIDELGRPGCAPVRVRGGSLAGGRVEIDAGESSQYVSALLMAGLRAEGRIQLLAPFLVSSPYVDTTLQVMADFGSSAGSGGRRRARVPDRTPQAGGAGRPLPGGRRRLGGRLPRGGGGAVRRPRAAAGSGAGIDPGGPGVPRGPQADGRRAVCG